MADVHRAGGIGQDELHQNPLLLLGAAGAEALPGGEHTGERANQPAVGEEQIHEARPRHLEALELRSEPLSERLAQTLGDSRGGAPRLGASSRAAFVE